VFSILPLVRGELESFVRGRGSSLYRIREYMPEDSARHVDWKATAKSGSLKVREFAREDECKLRIIFDNPDAGVISQDEYEKAVDLAASVAWHFAHQDAEVSFVASGHPVSRDLHEFLGWLAVVEPAGAKLTGAKQGKSGATAGVSAADGGLELNGFHSDDYKIVITARSRGSLPTAWWDSAYFIFIGNLAESPRPGSSSQRN
jgi:hypothetical protein